jgi:tetratricopeptide (TPR) repeat protein
MNEATTTLTRAAIAESLGDLALGVVARFYVGLAHTFCGKHRKALEFCRRHPDLAPDEVIALRRAPSGPGLLYGPTAAYNYIFSLNISSFCLAELGELDEAFTLSEQAALMADAFEMSYLRATVDAYMGYVHLRRGDLQRAMFLLERCVRTYETADARMAEVIMAGMLGPAFTLSGRVADAIALFERVSEFAQAKTLTSYRTPALAHLGDAYSRAGRSTEAIATDNRALDLAREHGLRGYEAWALYLLGEVYSREVPHLNEIRQGCVQAGQVAGARAGDASTEAMCALGLGAVCAPIGKRDLARAELITAATAFRAMGMQFWLEKAETALDSL